MSQSVLFWIIALVLTIAVVRLLVAPIGRNRQVKGRSESDMAVYRDQLAEIDRDLERGLINEADADAARTEVSRRLLAADNARKEAEGKSRPGGPSRGVLIACALAVPLVAIPLYFYGGAPGLPSQPHAERLNKPLEDLSAEEIVARVEEHLRTNPDDAQGWRLIAPVYGQLGRFEDAAAAFARAIRLDGADAQLLSRYGEALVFADEGLVRDDARSAFQEALKLDPAQARARLYMGLAFEQDGDIQTAREIWQALADETPPESPLRRVLEQRLAALGGTQAAPLGGAAGAGIAALPPEERAAAIASMVEGLSQRLASEGGTPEEWARLVRARRVMNQPEAADAAVADAREALAEDAEALARFEALLAQQ